MRKLPFIIREVAATKAYQELGAQSLWSQCPLDINHTTYTSQRRERGAKQHIHGIALDEHLRPLLDQIVLDPREQQLHRHLALAILGRGDLHHLALAVLGRGDLHLVHLGGVLQEQLQPAPATPTSGCFYSSGTAGAQRYAQRREESGGKVTGPGRRITRIQE